MSEFAELTDEKLEVYALPDARRLVIAAALALDDAAGWGISIDTYVDELRERAQRLRALDAEHGRRIDRRLNRSLAGLD